MNTEEVILLGLPPKERGAALRAALAAALERRDPVMVALCLSCTGSAAERRALASAAFAAGPLCGQTMLHAALAPADAPDTADAALVFTLLRASASPSAVDSQTRTACHVAAARGRSAALQLLLDDESGAAASAAALRSRNGQTAIAAALGARPHRPTHCECVGLLLRSRCPADGSLTLARGRGSGFSQLHLAVAASCAACTSALLARSADPRARSKRDGITPLHLAAQFDGTGRIVELLLRAAADPRATGAAGETAVHAAASAWNGRVLARILDSAADPAAAARRRDASGATPLHHLAVGGAVTHTRGAAGGARVGAIARLLLRHRAEPDALALDRTTPLARAIARLASARPTPPSAKASFVWAGGARAAAARDSGARARGATEPVDEVSPDDDRPVDSCEPDARSDTAASAAPLAVCAVLIAGGATVDARALALLRAGPAAGNAADESTAAGRTCESASDARRACACVARDGRVASLRALCEFALCAQVGAETAPALHALALDVDARALRAACEDYALQLGVRGVRSCSLIHAVLRQMTSAWAPAAWAAGALRDGDGDDDVCDADGCASSSELERSERGHCASHDEDSAWDDDAKCGLAAVGEV